MNFVLFQLAYYYSDSRKYGVLNWLKLFLVDMILLWDRSKEIEVGLTQPYCEVARQLQLIFGDLMLLSDY